MFHKKITISIVVTNCIVLSFLLSGCATNNLNSSTAVGPTLSSSHSEPIKTDVVGAFPKIDVIIPVFDPGLPEDEADYEDENIWPELRRAEANRFPYKLKEELDKTGKFGSIRVTPDKSATGELYILGRIEESNGEEVEISIKAIDISGSEWLDQTFEHEVSEAFHKSVRNKGKDPYDPLFEEVADTIINIADPSFIAKKNLEAMYKDQTRSHSGNEKGVDQDNLRDLSNLRFGANYLDSAFMQYFEIDGGRYKLVSKPSDDDPMFQRVKALRVRDQLFYDNLQNNYAAFSAQMNDSYLMWQEQSLLEIQAERSANRKAIGQAIGGVALIGLGVLSAVAGASSNSNSAQAAGAMGAILGGVGGAVLISESFKTSEEAKIHRDSLNELGRSVDLEVAPQVIAFEKESVELTGNAKEQSRQWRMFLQRMYSEEKTPDVQF